MYRTAHLHAYDVLDTVVISAQVAEFDDPSSNAITKTLTWRCELQSFGDDDPSVWLWRALQVLQEELDQRPHPDAT